METVRNIASRKRLGCPLPGEQETYTPDPNETSLLTLHSCNVVWLSKELRAPLSYHRLTLQITPLGIDALTYLVSPSATHGSLNLNAYLLDEVRT